jgi:hypothetical protein
MYSYNMAAAGIRNDLPRIRAYDPRRTCPTRYYYTANTRRASLLLIYVT